MKGNLVVMLLAGVVIGLVIALAGWRPRALGQPAEKAAKAQRWEYKVVAFPFENEAATKKLNEMADDGWEYVGLVNTTRATPPPGRGASVAFRRPKK